MRIEEVAHCTWPECYSVGHRAEISSDMYGVL